MKSSSMITLIVLMVATVAVQFALNWRIDNFLHVGFIAAIILFIATFCVTGSEPSDETEAKSKWKSLGNRDISYAIQQLKRKKYQIGSFARLIGFFTTSIPIIIIGFIAFVLSAEDNPQSGMLFLDIFLFARCLLCIIYNITPDHFNDKLIDNNLIKKLETCKSIQGMLPPDLNYNLDFQVELEKRTKTIAKDAKLNIVPSEQIPGMLCAMISLSLNNVQGNMYPYAYAVFVFKGTRLQQNVNLSRELQDVNDSIIEDGYLTHGALFNREVQVQDGNTIYVFTKAKGTTLDYHTRTNDCQKLVELTSKVIRVFNENADMIKRQTGGDDTPAPKKKKHR